MQREERGFLAKYYICIEIGGTNLRYGLVDTNFSIIKFSKIATDKFSSAKDKIEFLSDLIEPLIVEYGKKNILYVSMGLASLMNKERTVVYSSPMIKGFENIEIVKLLQSKIGIPVVIEKDVNLLLLYEIRKMQLTSDGIIAGIFLGTGLGNAICINGRIYKGNSGSACELGHIPVPGLNQECGCGKKGCFELIACGKILRELAEKHYKCDVKDIFKYYGNEKKVLDQVYYSAVAIATEITILDPSHVILGGGVIEAEGFPMEFLLQSIRENLRSPNPREAVIFIQASGDAEAGVIGAAIHASQISNY